MAEPVTRREVALSLPLLPLNASESVRYAREAANLGYGECWIGEVGGPDAFTLAAAVLTTTPLIVGTAAVNVFTRSPMVLAMTGASLDQLSEGRFILGIGTSSETIVERWSGLPFRKPFTRMRETIPVLRDLLEGMKVSFEGEVVRLSDYRVTVPVRQPPPIYVAALGPRMLRLAGQLADGVIINLLGPEHVPVVLAEVAAGAKKVHREPASIRVVLRVQVIPDATDEVAFVVVRSAFGRTRRPASTTSSIGGSDSPTRPTGSWWRGPGGTARLWPKPSPIEWPGPWSSTARPRIAGPGSTPISTPASTSSPSLR